MQNVLVLESKNRKVTAIELKGIRQQSKKVTTILIKSRPLTDIQRLKSSAVFYQGRWNKGEQMRLSRKGQTSRTNGRTRSFH